MSFKSSNHTSSAELLGSLILEELKGIRKDIKEEVRTLGQKLEDVLLSHLTRDSFLNSSSKVKSKNMNIIDVDDLDSRNNKYLFSESPNALTCKEAEFENYTQNSDTDRQIDINKSSQILFANFDNDNVESHQANIFIKEELSSETKMKSSEHIFVGNDDLNEIHSTNNDRINSKNTIKNSFVLPTEAADKNNNASLSSLSSFSGFSFLTEEPEFVNSQNFSECSKRNSTFLNNDSSIENNFLPLHKSISSRKHLFPSACVDSLTLPHTQKQSKALVLQDNSGFSIFPKRYKCQICDRMFAQKKYAEMHIRTHNGEKPFKCSVCNVGFLTKGNLKRHLIVHTGEKPFTCTYCNKSFAFSTNLKRHIRIHLRLTNNKDNKSSIAEPRAGD